MGRAVMLVVYGEICKMALAALAMSMFVLHYGWLIILGLSGIETGTYATSQGLILPWDR